MSPKSFTLTVVLLLLVAGAAFAQVAEFGATVGAARLSQSTLEPATATVPESKLNSGFRFGFRITLNTHRYLGHEVGYAYSRTNLDYQGTVHGTATHQGFYDFLVYGTSEGSRIRPFIAAGGGFSNFIFPGLSVTSGGGEMKFGVNYGGGVKVKVAEKWLVRVDFRQYASPKPDFPGLFVAAPQGWVRINEMSAGFAYTL